MTYRFYEGELPEQRAEDRGYEPSWDDLNPPANHLLSPPGVDPLLDFAEDVRAHRYVGELTRCSHPHCRTSVTEDTVVFCPHNRPFCPQCSWADGCPDCSANHSHETEDPS